MSIQRGDKLGVQYALRADVRRLGDELSQARPRLAALQHLLIDLLASLDPKYVRFPEDRRTEV